METPITSLAAKNGLALGYGLGIRSELFKGHRIYQHGGDADGYLAHFGYNKDSKRGYFIVINAFRHDILQQFKTELNHWLIENLSKPKSLLSAIISQQHLQTLTGPYQPASYRFSPSQNQGIEIKVENKLYRRLSNQSSWFELVPYQNGYLDTQVNLRRPSHSRKQLTIRCICLKGMKTIKRISR
jgi:hypothetical protein